MVDTSRPEQQAAFARTMRGTDARCVGTVTRARTLVITGLAGRVIVREPLDGLKAAWQEPLAW